MMINIQLIGMVVGFFGVIYYSIFIAPKKEAAFWKNRRIYWSYHLANFLFLCVIGTFILDSSGIIPVREDIVLNITYLWGISGITCSYNEHIKLTMIKDKDVILSDEKIHDIKIRRATYLFAGVFFLIGTYIVNL